MASHTRNDVRGDGGGAMTIQGELDNRIVLLYKKITSGAVTPDVLINLKGLNLTFNSLQVKGSLFLTKSQDFYQF